MIWQKHRTQKNESLIFLRSIFLPLLAFAFKNKRETQQKWVIRMAVFFSLVLHRGEESLRDENRRSRGGNFSRCMSFRETDG
jgi:hypothetical protein